MKVTVISPSRESEKAISGYSTHLITALKEEGVDVTMTSYAAGYPLTLLKKIFSLKKYDVIHIEHEYNLLGWYGIPFFVVYFLLYLSGRKIITTMHTVLSQKEKFIGNPIKTFLRKILYLTQNRVINKVSDKTIVHAIFFKNILIKEYGFSKKKIITLPQGIISDVKVIPKNLAKKKLGLSGNIYLIIGNFVPDHGTDIILKKAKEIGKTILVVTNPQGINYKKQKRQFNYLMNCIKYVREKNLSRYVKFNVFKIDDTNQIWWDYFSAADLVLLPYRGGIGSGIFAHAMATRKPVIGSNIPYFNEIAKKYGCIKIAKTEDDYSKVIREAMQPKKYRAMVLECIRYAKENSWESIAKKYKKIYLTL